MKFKIGDKVQVKIVDSAPERWWWESATITKLIDSDLCEIQYNTGTVSIPYLIENLRPYPKDIGNKVIREFSTGATRDSAEGKYDYSGFLHPLVLNRFAQYMQKHRLQTDGTLRDSDNWQKGIPTTAYMEGMFRHFMDVWSINRGITPIDLRTNKEVSLEEALCAMFFNVQGMLYNQLQNKKEICHGDR